MKDGWNGRYLDLAGNAKKLFGARAPAWGRRMCITWGKYSSEFTEYARFLWVYCGTANSSGIWCLMFLNYWVEACVSLFQSLRRSLQKQSGAGFNDEWNSWPDHLRLQDRTVLWQSPSAKSSNQKGIYSSKSGRFLRPGCLADICVSFADYVGHLHLPK